MPNPVADALTFLSRPGLATVAFWLLLLVGVAVAVLAWRREPGQRRGRHVGIALLRGAMGVMWWQQSLWKIPPDFAGLTYWMKQMAEHAWIPLQGRLVSDVVLPRIGVFGPLVYGVEVLIAVSLMLGVATRMGAALGAAMAANLWLGLYSAPGEWPWTYGFLIIIQLLFVIDPPGRSLGVDALRRGP